MNDGWNEWSKHVLKSLERIDTDLQRVEKGVNEVKLEIAMLKVKASIWGGLAGTIPIIILEIMRR